MINIPAREEVAASRSIRQSACDEFTLRVMSSQPDKTLDCAIATNNMVNNHVD